MADISGFEKTVRICGERGISMSDFQERKYGVIKGTFRRVTRSVRKSIREYSKKQSSKLTCGQTIKGFVFDPGGGCSIKTLNYIL